MQDMQLLHDGLTLMGVGMGFVFVFLTVLVAGTTLMSLLVRRLSPAPAATATATPAAGRRVEPARDDAADAELMAVLSAAVHRYRRRHRR